MTAGSGGIVHQATRTIPIDAARNKTVARNHSGRSATISAQKSRK